MVNIMSYDKSFLECMLYNWYDNDNNSVCVCACVVVCVWYVFVCVVCDDVYV